MVIVSFKTNIDKVTNDFSILQKEIKDKIIDNGFDDILTKALPQLKKQLQAILTEYQRIETNKQTTEPSKVIQPPVQLPDSKEAIIKHLSGLDIREYNNQKDKTDYYSKNSNPRLVYSQDNRNRLDSTRVELKIPISPEETVQTQFQQAKKFFQEAIFAFPSERGQFDLIMNVNPNIDENIKIKCSKYTGDDDFEEFGGMSPSKRFESDKVTKNYAIWTLKQDFTQQIKDYGINLSRIAESLLEGEYDDAKNYLSSLGYGNKEQVKDLNIKIDELERNENLQPDVESIKNISQLIKNLRVNKKISPQGTTYSLISDYGEIKNMSFEADLDKQVSFWKNTNEAKWIKTLKNKIIEIIKKFYSRTI